MFHLEKILQSCRVFLGALICSHPFCFLSDAVKFNCSQMSMISLTGVSSFPALLVILLLFSLTTAATAAAVEAATAPGAPRAPLSVALVRGGTGWVAPNRGTRGNGKPRVRLAAAMVFHWRMLGVASWTQPSSLSHLGLVVALLYRTFVEKNCGILPAVPR